MGVSKRFARYEGDSFSRSLDLTTPTGQPYDLTGTTIWFIVKQDPEDADDDATLWLTWNNGVGDGISVVDPETGELVVSRTAQQMSDAFEPGLYTWFLRVRDTTGFVRTLDAGLFDIMPGPTELTV